MTAGTSVARPGAGGDPAAAAESPPPNPPPPNPRRRTRRRRIPPPPNPAAARCTGRARPSDLWHRDDHLVTCREAGLDLDDATGRQAGRHSVSDLLAAGHLVDDGLAAGLVHRQRRDGQHVRQLLVDDRDRRGGTRVQSGGCPGDLDDDRVGRRGGRTRCDHADRRDSPVHDVSRVTCRDLRLQTVLDEPDLSVIDGRVDHPGLGADDDDLGSGRRSARCRLAGRTAARTAVAARGTRDDVTDGHVDAGHHAADRRPEDGRVERRLSRADLPLCGRNGGLVRGELRSRDRGCLVAGNPRLVAGERGLRLGEGGLERGGVDRRQRLSRLDRVTLGDPD